MGNHIDEMRYAEKEGQTRAVQIDEKNQDCQKQSDMDTDNKVNSSMHF